MRRPSLTFAGVLLVAGLLAPWATAPAEAHKRALSSPVVVDAPEAGPALGDLPDERPRLGQPPLGRQAPLGWKSAPTPPQAPWIVLFTLAAAAVVGARRRRRALALALVLVLAVFAFETALHSVHHLSDRGPAASCAISLGSQHEAAALADCIAIDEPGVIAGSAPHPSHPGTPVIRSLAPHQGRAPPVRPA